jgi:hypothetical protein
MELLVKDLGEPLEHLSALPIMAIAKWQDPVAKVANILPGPELKLALMLARHYRTVRNQGSMP